MPHPSRDDLLQRGEQLLKDWGIAPEAEAPALTELAGRDVASDLAIAARLGKGTGSVHLEALEALKRACRDKLVQKEIKRSLYRLSQRGVEVPREDAGSVVHIAAPTLEGYLSAVDGQGDQLVWLVRARPGSLDHMIAVLNDPEGLREVALAETTRKSLRAAAEEMCHRHEIEMVPADWRYCDFLVARAWRWATERGRKVVGDYRGLRARLVHEAAPDALPSPARTVLDSPGVRSDNAALAGSGELLREKEFRTWFFPPEKLAPYLEQLQRVKESPIVLSEVQQRDRFGEIIRQAVEEIFGGVQRESWVRRFEAMAYYFHSTRRPRQARLALSVALALEAAEHGGRDIPFCEMLTRTCFTAYWQASEQKEVEQAEGSLVITPAQAAQMRRKRPS